MLRGSIQDATNAVKEAKLSEKSEEYEKKRVEMLAVFQTERDRLDAALKASCDEVDREAEAAAAAIRSKYEQRIKNAEKKVEAADKAILADANSNPLAENKTEDKKEEEKKQPEDKKEEKEEPKQPEDKKEEQKKEEEPKQAEVKKEEQKPETE